MGSRKGPAPTVLLDIALVRTLWWPPLEWSSAQVACPWLQVAPSLKIQVEAARLLVLCWMPQKLPQSPLGWSRSPALEFGLEPTE